MLERIISGGQTGVDQLALVVARSFGVPTGGWAPKGFLTEKGPRPWLGAVYGLREHESPEYPPRTRKNIGDADYTLILTRTGYEKVDRGTALTRRLLGESGKDGFLADVDTFGKADYDRVVASLLRCGAKVVNVAGPRGSGLSNVQKRRVQRALEYVLKCLAWHQYFVVPDRMDVYGDEAGEVGARAGTRTECLECDRDFLDHPPDMTRLTNPPGGSGGAPFLHVLCDGRVVKL